MISTDSTNKDQLLIISAAGILTINPRNTDGNAKFTEIMMLISDQKLDFDNILLPNPSEASFNLKCLFLTNEKRKRLELEQDIIINDTDVQLSNKILIFAGKIEQLQKN